MDLLWLAQLTSMSDENRVGIIYWLLKQDAPSDSYKLDGNEFTTVSEALYMNFVTRFSGYMTAGDVMLLNLSEIHRRGLHPQAV